MISYHDLPPGLLASLGGPGDRTEIEVLHAGQVSRRVVQLRVILDLAQRNAPEASARAGLRDSFAALCEVQRRDPATVAALLGSPQVGAWAARCVRQFTGEVSETPLWLHLAHLGAIAAAAAIRSGTCVAVKVPVRGGITSLPTLGRAVVNQSEPWGLTVCTPGNPVLLDGSPPLDWWPIPLLETDAMSVLLDNADPYWDCFGLPVSAKLDEAAIEWWQQQFADAWAVIGDRHRHRLAAMTAAIRCLVPLEQGGRFGGASASSKNAPGAVALTEPVKADRFAATLVHEVQHFRVYALHDLVPLHQETRDLLYSPWRNDPRGLPGLLHGTAAFLAVADFWERERGVADPGIDLMYARTVRQLRVGCRILGESAHLTPAGRAVADALADAIAALPHSDPVVEVGRLADDLVAQHQAMWRLRNVAPDAAGIAEAEKWLRGEDVALTDRVEQITAGAAPGGDSPLFRLAVAWLEDPDQVRADAADPEAFAERHPGADSADLPMLAGDYAAALRLRVAQIADGTGEPGAWAALSVAHGRLCAEPGSSLLVTRPELVRAAWPRLVDVTPDFVELLSRWEGKRRAGENHRHVAGTSISDSIRR